MATLEQLDKNRIPQHVAIIMDGNGRWAKARGLDRSADTKLAWMRCTKYWKLPSRQVSST